MKDHETLVPAAKPDAPSAPGRALVPASGRLITTLAATRATTDEQLLKSWLAALGSDHTRRNFETTARRFFGELGCPLRGATVEDVRDALERLVAGKAVSTARQLTLRVKSLLSYGHRLGYLAFNAGVAIRAPREMRALAKRIVGEIEVADLVRAAVGERDFLMVAVTYASGLRVSELVGLSCGDVLVRDLGMVRRVQLHVVGKGGKERELLLPEDLGVQLLAFIAGRPSELAVFCSTRKGRETERLTARGANHLIKRLARDATVTDRISPHWLRHAHASHALDRGAPLSLVSGTLGHASVSTTSVYLHAKPGSSSGDNLDASVWQRRANKPTSER